MVQRKSELTALYQQGHAQKAQQLPPRGHGLNGNNAAKMNASALCRMLRKFPCAKQDGTSVCGKDYHSSLHGLQSKFCKAMYVNFQTGRRRGSG